MEKKTKTGILLILAALCLGGIFLWQVYRNREGAGTGTGNKNSRQETGNTASAGSVSGTWVPPVPAETWEPSPDGTEDWADIDPDILRYMEITEEITKELRIYANECGCGAADRVEDLEEMIVDYGKKTVTVPCSFKTGKNVSKFDMVYQYEEKEYRFVPW